MTLQQQIEKFEKETGIELEIWNGKPYCPFELPLSGTRITSLPDNLVVRGFIDLCDTGITSLPQNLVVGDVLDLDGCKNITSLPDNLVVGESLYINRSGITSLPKNLLVGEIIFLRNTQITSLPESIVVGKNIYMPNGETIRRKGETPAALTSPDGKYIIADDVLTEVVSHRGNVWHVRRLGEERVSYLITDGEGHYAHGNTLEEAKQDLVYKITRRNTDDYAALTLTSTLTHEEAIVCYRTITGACAAGTRNFVENVLDKKKERYTIAEIIALTKWQYGHERFKEYFTKEC